MRREVWEAAVGRTSYEAGTTLTFRLKRLVRRFGNSHEAITAESRCV